MSELAVVPNCYMVKDLRKMYEALRNAWNDRASNIPVKVDGYCIGSHGLVCVSQAEFVFEKVEFEPKWLEEGSRFSAAVPEKVVFRKLYNPLIN